MNTGVEFPRAHNGDIGYTARARSGLLQLSKRSEQYSLSQLLSLRGLAADTLLIILYLVLSRAFIGDEAKLGIKAGPVPLFVTDALILGLIAINLHKRAGRLLSWLFGGSGAGEIGRAAWLLFLLAIVYCLVAIPQYQIMALHDLAIFGYCIFFPLTYFALAQRIEATKLVRYSIYATCVGAILFNFQVFSGVQIFALTENGKGLPGGHQALMHTNANNLGAALGPALAGLFAYLSIERDHRIFHAGAFLLCLASLAQLMDRSAFLGFFIATSLMFILGVGRSRLYFTILAAGLFMLVVISSEGELPIPGGARLHSFWLAVSSGADMRNDPDGQFRLQRWRKTVAVWMTSPILGVGFGAPIMVDTSGENLRDEAKETVKRGALGAFNVGMPHNSFLMVLARTGIIGLSLICFAWFGGVIRTVKLVRRRVAHADQLATVGILVAMISTAALNLFFERPMLCAPFWIILAASYRLSENTPQHVAVGCTRAVLHPAFEPSLEALRNRPIARTLDPSAGGWQARWK